MPSLEAEKLWPLAEEYCRYSQAVGRMEQNGLLMDVPFIEAQIEHCDRKQEELRIEAFRVAGREFNMNSPKQIGEIIGQKETNREALEVCEHPVAQIINIYRQLGKARDTYLKVFLETKDANNLIHPDMLLAATVSGRMAMKRPSFNTLPRPNKLYDVRGSVIARPGYTLLDADYSQLELRLLAHFSADPNLLHAYHNGIDVHQQTADMLGIPRQVAKRVNFSVVYGAGDKGLIHSLKMEGVWLRKILREMSQETQDRAINTAKMMIRRDYGSMSRVTGEIWEDYLELGAAKNILEDYKRRFPMVEAYIKRTIDFAKRNRFIPMWTGRLRRYPQFKSNTGGWYNLARTAPNNQIQGGANEILRIAITNLDKKFEKLKSQGERVPLMILAVHDSLVAEIPEGEESYWIPFILHEMSHTAKFKVPIVADAKVGQRWSELEKWKGA